MKIFIKSFLCVLSLFIFCNDVFAVCENDELNDWAEEVNIIFEQQYAHDEFTDLDGTVVPAYEPEYSYILYLLPGLENLKVYVTDNITNKRQEVEVHENYGYMVGSEVHFETKKYTFDIYSVDDSDKCPGEKLRTIKYSVPPYNMYSQTLYCAENMTEDICAGYYDGVVDKDDFYERVEEIENEKNKTFLDKVLEIVKEYWFFVVIPLVIVSVFYFIKIWKYKKNEREDLKDDEEEDDKRKSEITDTEINNVSNDEKGDKK